MTRAILTARLLIALGLGAASLALSKVGAVLTASDRGKGERQDKRP